MDTAIVPTQQAFNQMHANGVEVFRLAIQWPEVEPRPPLKVGGYEFHRYNWKRPDEEMRELVSAGLRPHLSLIGSPYWVASSYATSPMRSAAGRRGWPAFVAAVARRYGPGGTFWKLNPDLPVYAPDVYQIWNEPNSQIAYAPKADPNEYAQLFRLAGKRILQADPRVRDPARRDVRDAAAGALDVRLGLPAASSSSQPHMTAYVGGYRGASLREGLRGVKYQVRKMRKAAHKAGLGSLPLYITEIGWSSEKPNGNIFYKGLKGQAKAIKKALGLLVRKQRKWHLKRILWFTWSDLSRAGGRPSPAAASARRWGSSTAI